MPSNAHHIKSVYINDFLSYVDTKIEFSPLTAIIGANLQGKSSIRRALAYALLNEGRVSDDPEVDNIRRILPDGKLAKQATVIVEFNDGLIVERSRGIGINEYHLTLQSGEKISIGGKGSSVGRNVPEEVEIATGFRQILWPDKTKTSIQFQNDAVDGKFLLSDKNVAIDTKLGFIIGADIIESAVKQATTEGISTSRERTKVNKELAEINTRLENFAGVDELEERVNALDIKSKNFAAARDIAHQGNTYADKIAALKHRLVKMATVEEDIARVEALAEKCKAYQSYAASYHKAYEVTQVWNTYSKLPDNKIIQEVDNRVNELYTVAAEIRNGYDKVRDVNKLSDAIVQAHDTIKQTLSLIERVEQEQEELIKSVPACPLTGNVEDVCILSAEEL